MLWMKSCSNFWVCQKVRILTWIEVVLKLSTSKGPYFNYVSTQGYFLSWVTKSEKNSNLVNRSFLVDMVLIWSKLNTKSDNVTKVWPLTSKESGLFLQILGDLLRHYRYEISQASFLYKCNVPSVLSLVKLTCITCVSFWTFFCGIHFNINSRWLINLFYGSRT